MRMFWMAVAICGGCSAGSLQIANRVALGASTAVIACDWHQTHKAASTNWKNLYEDNPIMGKNPSTNSVDLYFLGVLALNIAAWRLMPAKLRLPVSVAFVAWQGMNIIANEDSKAADMHMCGFADHSGPTVAE